MNKTTVAYISQASAWLIWSMDSIMVRMIGDDVPRPIMSGMSFFIAGLILFPNVIKGFRSLVRQRELIPSFLYYILFTSVLAELLYVLAIQNLNPGLVSLTLRSQLILATIAAAIFFGEKIGKAVIAGIVIAVSGYVCMAFSNGEAYLNTGRNASLGWICIAATSILWTSGTLFGKKLLQKIEPAQLTGMRMFTAGIIPLLFMLCTKGITPYMALSGQQWGLFIIKGTFCSALAYCLYMKGLHSTSVTAASAMEQMAPLFTLMVATFLLHEPIAPSQWCCVAVVFAGAAIILYNQYKVLNRQQS